jgi:hypothetical protein
MTGFVNVRLQKRRRFMLRIAIIVFIFMVLNVDYVFSNPDTAEFRGGDVRISGTGNGLVFRTGAFSTVPRHRRPSMVP